MLALLLLRSNQVVSDTELIDEIWPHDPPRRAREALQAHISRLRNELPPLSSGAPRLAWAEHGYRLGVEHGELDLTEFDTLRRVAAQQREREPSAARSSLRTALALWRGPAQGYPGPARTRLYAAAQRLNEDHTRTLEELVELHIALDNPTDVIGELRELTERYPLPETFLSQLMRALIESGRHAEAATLFHHTQHELRSATGLDPSPHMQRLLESALHGDTNTPDLWWGQSRTRR